MGFERIEPTWEEPILTDEDLDLWAMWMRGCALYAETKLHKSRVLEAERIIRQAMAVIDKPVIAWSGGKESTILAHIVCVKMGLRVPVMSLFTDLEPPGTRAYMDACVKAWDLDMEYVEPPVSFWQYLVDHAHEIDIHSAVTTGHTHVGKIWDETMERWWQQSGYTGMLWGLRDEESRARKINTKRRGVLYQNTDGRWKCAPFSSWEGRDVYAYCAAHGVDLHPLYRCIRYNAKDPSRVRKAMWIPGSHGAMGAMIWLRTYYPSLYMQLVQVYPEAASLG